MSSHTARTKCRTGTQFPSAAITFAKPAQRQFRSWRLLSGTRLPMCKRRSIAAWTSIPLLPVCPSSSIRITTFSKRLPNFGRHAAFGPGSLKTGLGPKIHGPKCFVFTRRPRVHPLRHNNRTIMSSELRFRRSRPYSAGHSRCTRIPKMKLSRYLQLMRQGLPYGRSKSLLMSREFPIRWILSVDPMPSRR